MANFHKKLSSLKISKILGLSIVAVTVIVNIVLKGQIIGLFERFGPDTRSEQNSKIIEGVFLAQFFNTAFILLIINANLSEHSPESVTKFFDGPFYDYSVKWYRDVGDKVCLTIMIESLIPFIRMTKMLTVRRLKIWLDTGFSNDPYKTKKTNMHSYKDVYCGEIMKIHFLYAETLSITFCTMLYGLHMPILFPLAALAISSKRFF